MYRYESDEKAIRRAVAEADGWVISDGTARAISAQFNDRGTASFVTTGFFEGDIDDLMFHLMNGVDNRTISEWSTELDALELYLEDRVDHVRYGKVEGWNGAWVDKHIDYPHHGGQLPDCWCHEDEDYS